MEFEGLVYKSSESVYHAAKYPKDQRADFAPLDAESAKKLSQKKGFDQTGWTERKEPVMRAAEWAKFTQNKDLGDKLIATGHRTLEAASLSGDKYWGVFKGEGQNVLGRILMDVRAKLILERQKTK